MLIKKSEAKKFENAKSCTVSEYEVPSKQISYATALINGRYPETGRAMNESCEELYAALSGSGVIHSEKGDFEIHEGDVYFFERGERYWVEGNSLTVALVNAPAWTREQFKIVE